MSWWQQLDSSTQWWISHSVALLIGAGVCALVAAILVAKKRDALERQILGLEAEMEAERRVATERERAFVEQREQLEASFSHLSTEALKRNTEAFLNLAQQRFKTHQVSADAQLQERSKAIENLVKPISDALRKTENQVREMEKERKQAFGALERHLDLLATDHKALRQETRNLVSALRRPEVRGRWGEMTLKRLVELAGMVEHCDFEEQAQVSGDGGRFRPDMLIHLPDDRLIVVDVKTPLDAYLTAQEAPDDASREKAMMQHVRNVRERVRELSQKAYWDQFSNSPDFVVLFIPGEQFLAAAMDRDPGLLENALQNRVILASPTSLVALLRAVAFSWRQVDMMRNAEKIRALAETLHKRAGIFTEHFRKVGKALQSSVDHYNSTLGSFERNFIPAARKLEDLGVRATKELEEPPPIDKKVRE